IGDFSQPPDQLLVNGAEASILNVAASPVEFVVPSVAPGPAAISVLAGGTQLASGQFTIVAAGPGIFVQDMTDPAQRGMITNQDLSANSSMNRATVGSVVHITATGYGPLDPSGSALVTVLFGDTPSQVLTSGPIAATPGIWQIDARVPPGVAGQVPLYILAGNLPSNGVTVWVEQ